MSAFKGRHKFNKNIRNGKRHVKIFPAEGNLEMFSRKISFHGNITRDVLFAEKVVMCYRCKTRHMLDENCPVATPTPDDLDVSTSEQCATPRESMSPEQSEPFVETSSSEDSLQDSSSLVEGGGGLTEELLRVETLAWTVIQRRRQKWGLMVALICVLFLGRRFPWRLSPVCLLQRIFL